MASSWKLWFILSIPGINLYFLNEVQLMLQVEFQLAEPQEKISLQFEVLNTLVAPNEAGVLEFDLEIEI